MRLRVMRRLPPGRRGLKLLGAGGRSSTAVCRLPPGRRGLKPNLVWYLIEPGGRLPPGRRGLKQLLATILNALSWVAFPPEGVD